MSNNKRSLVSRMELGGCLLIFPLLVGVVSLEANAQNPAAPAEAAPPIDAMAPGGLEGELEAPADVTGVGDPQADASALLTGFMDPFEYDPRGRKDPFARVIADRAVEQGAMHGPLLPLQRFEITQLRLVGILWDVRRPKAMFKDPEGATHVVGPNAKVGPRNGYVAVIREGEVVVVETIEQEGRLVSTAQVVKIAR